MQLKGNQIAGPRRFIQQRFVEWRFEFEKKFLEGVLGAKTQIEVTCDFSSGRTDHRGMAGISKMNSTLKPRRWYARDKSSILVAHLRDKSFSR